MLSANSTTQEIVRSLWLYQSASPEFTEAFIQRTRIGWPGRHGQEGFKRYLIVPSDLENGFRTHFSISTQLRSTDAIIDVEEILKNENPETRDYIYRIERESIDRRKNFCFVRYKCGSDSENPIFDDELKQFQIYTEVGTVETNMKAEFWFRDDLRICC